MNKEKLILLIILLVLLTPLYQALTNLRISIAQPEVLLVIASTILVSFFFSVFAIWGGQRTKILLLTLFTCIFLDIAIGFREISLFVFTDVSVDDYLLDLIRKIIKLLIIIIIITGIYVLFWKMRKNIAVILSVFYSIVAICL